MAPDKRLVVIDGYSLLFRAFYGTRFLSTADGRPTNALLGFTNMLLLLLEKIHPTAIVVALDAPGKTFRHAEFPEYKGTRKETPPELISQFPVARELVAALGIPQIELTGFEADDIVGTVSRIAESHGYVTTIVTGDLDSLQLVDDCVSVLTTRQGVTDTVTYTPEAVRERYGFGPEFVPDYKAIVGDTSDNIPGVPGLGAKAAEALIGKFGTIETMLERFEEIEPKYQKKMVGQEEQMRLSKKLATIDRQAPIIYDFKPFELTPQQMQFMVDMMDSLEFRNLKKRAVSVLTHYLPGGRDAAPEEVVAIKTEKLEVRAQDVADLAALREFVDGRDFAILIASPPGEATADLFTAPNPKKAFVAIGAHVRIAPEDAGLHLLRSHSSQAITYQAKPMFRQLEVGIAAPKSDVSIAGFVLQPGRGSYTLGDLVQGYLDVATPTVGPEMAVALGLLDAAMRDRLKKEDQERVYDAVEMPLVPILAEMENAGVRVSATMLRDFSKSLEIEIKRTSEFVYELAGEQFLIGSPQQLGKILFEKLQIPGAQKTKTGYATGVEVLQDLAVTYPICQEVLNWRELTKLKSTYTDALERLIGPDGRIHTTYNQTGAATGRLSSNDPNLQNIPIRTELGRGIRRAFLAAEGTTLASLDYSQIELRVLAHLCGDDALVRAFERHQDVHTVTAQHMFGLGDAAPSKDQRRLAKMLNYAVLYGVTDFGLAQQLGAGFSVAEAKGLIVQYNERFPKIKDFQGAMIQEARSKGFTTTLMGRRRYFPDIHAARINERRYAERQAVNSPIQGAAADMMKLAMIAASKRLRGRATRTVLNVHDELVFELAAQEHELIPLLRKDMEAALPLSVPVEVDAKLGENWDEMAPVA